MYLRTIQRHNKDGSTVRYLQLAHNHRKGKNTQAEVLLHLGREDRLDLEGLRRLVGSISRYLDGAGAPPVAGTDQTLVVEASCQLPGTMPSVHRHPEGPDDVTHRPRGTNSPAASVSRRLRYAFGKPPG
jgi:hypothetical protein